MITGTAYGDNQGSGSFRATTTIAAISRSIRKPFGMRVRKLPRELGSREACIPT